MSGTLAVILELSNEAETRRFVLDERRPAALIGRRRPSGRPTPADITVDDALMTVRMCTVSLGDRPEHVVLEDAGSFGGIYVDGLRRDRCDLVPGSVAILGSTTLRVLAGAPTRRPEGRVILLDGRGRVLLLRCVAAEMGDLEIWVTPGGGCDEGEAQEQAARRELEEETGVRADRLGPCLWRRRNVWRWAGRWYDSDEAYYLLRLSGEVVIDPRGRSDVERRVVKEHRWWAAGELAASSARFAPRKLGELLEGIIGGRLPAEPTQLAD